MFVRYNRVSFEKYMCMCVYLYVWVRAHGCNYIQNAVLFSNACSSMYVNVEYQIKKSSVLSSKCYQGIEN